MADLAIDDGELHVWSASLIVSPRARAACRRRLSDDERERAGRFRFDVDRDHFTVARGMLRHLLGAYVGVAAENVRFVYGPNGKPSLSGSILHFNLSHSGDRVVMAVTLDGPVGVDVERVRVMPDLDQIARKFFSMEESATVLQTPPAGRLEAFFRCWTRKEALIKATGEGLSYPLDQFAVSLDDSPRLLRVGTSPWQGRAVVLHHLTPAAGYVGAVAIHAHGSALRRCDYRLPDLD